MTSRLDEQRQPFAFILAPRCEHYKNKTESDFFGMGYLERTVFLEAFIANNHSELGARSPDRFLRIL